MSQQRVQAAANMTHGDQNITVFSHSLANWETGISSTNRGIHNITVSYIFYTLPLMLILHVINLLGESIECLSVALYPL